MTVALRSFASTDLDAVAELWYRSGHAMADGLMHPDPPAAWRERLRREIAPCAAVWLADDGGTVAGFVAVYVERGELDQIFVEPGRLRSGVGTALMAKAKDLCPSGLHLHTLVANARARALYERYGFRPGRTSVKPRNGQAVIAYAWAPDR